MPSPAASLLAAPARLPGSKGRIVARRMVAVAAGLALSLAVVALATVHDAPVARGTPNSRLPPPLRLPLEPPHLHPGRPPHVHKNKSVATTLPPLARHAGVSHAEGGAVCLAQVMHVASAGSSDHPLVMKLTGVPVSIPAPFAGHTTMCARAGHNDTTNIRCRRGRVP